MFSYFEGGITNTSRFKNISIERLLQMIGEYKPTIEEIRGLDINAADYSQRKRKLKSKLSYVTPNCTVTHRDDEHIDRFSGYLYFDIDNNGLFKTKEDVLLYKERLIQKYNNYIKLICVSSSGYGLSILVKVEAEVNADNFRSIREYVRNEIFGGIPLDSNTKDKTRAWYIPYDPDLFYNPYAIIEIPQEKSENRKSAIGNINNTLSDILPFAPSKNKTVEKKYSYRLINIGEVLDKLKFKTEVHVENKIFDIKDVEVCELYIPPRYKIPDGKKRQFYPIYIRKLFHLNPGIDADYIFSYLNWINEHKTVAGTKMEFGELLHLFSSIHLSISESGETRHVSRIKHIHFKEKTISHVEKKKVIREITDLLRMSNSINKVQSAKMILEENTKGAIGNINNTPSDILPFAPSEKVTQKDVCDYINRLAKEHDRRGISMRTVKTYWNHDFVDLKELERIENERLQITYIPKEVNEVIENENQQDNIVIKTEPDKKEEMKKKYTVDGLLGSKKQPSKSNGHLNEKENAEHIDGGVLDTQIQDRTGKEYVRQEEGQEVRNEHRIKPDWWRDLDHFVEYYGEDGKEMYEDQFDMLDRVVFSSGTDADQ